MVSALRALPVGLRTYATVCLNEAAVNGVYQQIFQERTRTPPHYFDEVTIAHEDKAKKLKPEVVKWISDLAPGFELNPEDSDLKIALLYYDKDKEAWTKDSDTITRLFLVLKACRLAKFSWERFGSEQRQAFELQWQKKQYGMPCVIVAKGQNKRYFD